MTSPASGAVLAGTSQTFMWSANGEAVTQWWLFVGTYEGAKGIYDSGSLGTMTSTTVSGLPSNGSKLYVTLWYKEAAGWETVKYTYTAASAP